MNSRRIARVYLDALGPTRFLIPLHLGVVFAGTLLASAPPLLLGLLVDRYSGGTTVRSLYGISIVALVVGAGLLAWLFEYVRSYLQSVVAERLSCSFQISLYAHLQRLSADFYQLGRVGEITARLTHDVNNGVRPMYHNMVEIISGLVMMGVALGYLWWHSLPMLGLFVVLSAITTGVSVWALPKVYANFRKLQNNNGALNGQITEAVSVHSLVRAFAGEQRARQRMRPLIDQLKEQQLIAESFLWRFMAWLWAFDFVLAPFAILLAGALLVANGSATAGSLVSGVLYWRMAVRYKMALNSGITAFMSGLGSLKRAVDFFDQTPLVADRADAVAFVCGVGTLCFTNVTFSYPQARDIFQLGPLDLRIGGGERCALLGVSGAGKSSLAQLISRVYDPQQGCITLDGTDIRQFKQRSLRSAIGFMTQDTQLFDASLRDNLLFADSAADDRRLYEVLEQAELGDFTATLEDGLDTRIGERGVRLSGGQRQRLAIARLLLLKPVIVILDEPTSALDAATENGIWKSIDHLFAGVTQLLITHRIASALHADNIVIIDQGRLIDQGDAAMLYGSCELFSRMCQAQQIVPQGGVA
jgi:ATP-binding cassette subfamily B protein